MEPVNLFIGSSSNNEDWEIETAYRYSLEENRNKNRPLNIHWMRQSNEGYWSGFQTPRWSTPFSGFRWAIPEFMNFKGLAVYTDVDMINFRDIGDLADEFMFDRPVLARRGNRFGGHEFCVMVMDCAKMRNEVIPVARQRLNPDYHHRMIDKFSGNVELTADLDPRWNCLDGDERKVDQIWQLHFTNMATQPWKPKWYTGKTEEHPRQDLVKLFEEYRNLGIKEGYDPSPSDTIWPAIEYNIIGR
jgi:hypothetical protein